MSAARQGIAWALATAVVVVLGGCAAKKDMRYLESREIPPLQIPADLDTPVYTGVMAIPGPSAESESRVPADEAALRALEQPPRRVSLPD
ncbi:MAG: hypothetical protein RBT81_02835 [Gammaproteobacteria bacterium]|nr:hypothetical protein [Gammaproteobacteria bacterium]